MARTTTAEVRTRNLIGDHPHSDKPLERWRGAVALPIGKAAAVVQARWDSVGTITAQGVVYHAADNRSTIARASIVAIARAVTVARATVIDRTTVDRSTAVAAPVSGNTAATSEASRMSATRDANRMTATSGHSKGARRVSNAGMTSWMAGS